MSDHRTVDFTPDYGEYSVMDLLQEYARKNPPAPRQMPAEPVFVVEKTPEPEPVSEPEAPPETAEEIAARSRQAAMNALGETLRKYRAEHPEPEPEPAPEPEPKPESEPVRPRVIKGEDGIITLQYDRPVSEAPEEAEDAPEEVPAEEPPSDAPAPERPKKLPSEPDKPSAVQRVLTPLVRRIATMLARRQMQTQEAANWPDPVDIRETPELRPGKAAKYYASLLGDLTLRLRIALGLTLVLAWIGFRLPMAGMLGRSLPLQAGVSLVLLLAVTMAALDVFSTGLRQLFDLQPGAEALASLSAFFAAVDAVAVLVTKTGSMPFCAIAAVALTAGLWGQRLTCRARRRTFLTAAATKTPSVLTTDGSETQRGSLLRSPRETADGIVRRSESQDFCATAYAAAAPFLLGASLLLAILASLGKSGGDLLHTFSALLCVSTSFAAFFAFPLPYAAASRRLRTAGAALAGYAGCADIGRNRRVVITDEDLFPPGTVKFSEINAAEGVFLGKVVSVTAALIEASGSGLTGLFRELTDRRGYRIPEVEEFFCHEGGGLSGLVGGERVFVGSAGFMNLQGIRLPQNMQTRNAVCTAVEGELVGVFVMEYIPVTSVQDALVTLLRGRTQTVFAIRDFNITPRMIGRLFRLPTEKFNFPSYRERYRLMGRAVQQESIDAVFSRAGMLPLVEAAEIGRKVYTACRLSAILALAGSVIGMLILFLLARAGSFDTASVGNLLLFMLLWSLPSVILSLGVNR